jgi:nitrous oxide reductase
MMNNNDKNGDKQVVRRRNFLAGAATTGAVGVAVVASGVLSEKQTVASVATDEASKGYQVTEHVRRYYRTTTV